MTVSGEFERRVFRVNGEIVFRKIAGEALLVPIRGRLADLQCIYALNPVGEFVWELLDGRRSLGLIRDRLVEAYRVGPEEAAADIDEFVAELLSCELICEAA